jgi:hypothetical protein
MTYGLEFRKGGILIENKWVYCEDKKEGSYVEVDITDKWFHKRDMSCNLQEGVTLDDVFLFIAREPEICDIIFVNCFVMQMYKDWCRSGGATKSEYGPDEIEYLELYWHPEMCDWGDGPQLEGDDRACFHGVGYELKEDKYESWQNPSDPPAFKKGTRINWAIDFSPIETLKALPIKLNEEFRIRGDWKKYPRDINIIPDVLSCKKRFSFEQIIHGVLWELSFHGSEADKADKKEELMSRVDEVKNIVGLDLT